MMELTNSEWWVPTSSLHLRQRGSSKTELGTFRFVLIARVGKG
jgi:hypothetical protein